MSDHVINSQLICADYTKNYPMIVSGKGVMLYDDSGKGYYDISGATAAVTNIGHGNVEMAEALKEQALKLSVHPTHVFDNPELENYLEELTHFAPEGFNRAWTISGGTEAIENAVKLAYQYHRSKGNRRTKVLGRWGSYHGNSLTALDLGGMEIRRSYYTDLMVGHHHVHACNFYRAPEGMSEQEYENERIEEFGKMLDQHGDEIICFFAEPIVGAALGAVGPTKNYFKRIYELCQEKDILVVADEVMTGFGRTGKRFGIEHFGNYADILAIAKGMSGGYVPLGGIIAHDRVTKPIQESGMPFFSGQTYSCIPLAARVGREALRQIEKLNLVENSANIGSYFKEKLEGLLDIDCVGDVRGTGLFLGIEFVADKKSKEILDQKYMFAKKVEARALEEGLVMYAARGSVNYTQGDHFLLAPPLILTRDDADNIFERLEKSIKDVWSEYTRG